MNFLAYDGQIELDEDDWQDDDCASQYFDQDYGKDDLCEFPGECCMPGYHTRDECHTAEMARQWSE